MNIAAPPPMTNPQVLDRWRERPDLFVREVFGVTPDPWQDDVLRQFPTSPRLAMLACKGPGKTAVLAWLGWNFLLTRPMPKIAATSVSQDNLQDNLWTEMALWQSRSTYLQAKFTWTKSRIFASDYPETWWMAARTWSKTADREAQSATLAGLHADYILFLIDESGSIPDAVMVSAEAALSSCIEGHIVQAGNPTMLEGPLYRAATSSRHLWYVVEITGDPDSPKRSPRISVEWAKEQIATYGADNPWVLVNVFGRFPPGSLNALIGPAEIEEAMKRAYREFQYMGAAKVMAVDVARFGDDKSALCKRQGIVTFPIQSWRNLTSQQGAQIIVREWNNWEADGCFVDATGGFGAGWMDFMRTMGKVALGVEYAGKPFDAKYFNKRAEMYFEAVDWIKAGGQLPPDNEISAALTQTTYTFKGDRLLLEPKEIVKSKLGYSPDHADAFVQTFAGPIAARGRMGAIGARSTHQSEYDPFAHMGAN